MTCSSARRRCMALLMASRVIFMLSSSGKLLTTQYENASGSLGIDSIENVSFQLCSSLFTNDIRCRCRHNNYCRTTLPKMYTIQTKFPKIRYVQ